MAQSFLNNISNVQFKKKTIIYSWYQRHKHQLETLLDKFLNSKEQILNKIVI